MNCNKLNEVSNPDRDEPSPRLPKRSRGHACELFAGAGGLSEGLRQAGFDIVCANEYAPAAAATYRLNHPSTRLIEGDITLEATKRAICDCFSDGPCDLLAGGVPCQPWSSSGRNGGFDDPRGQLWFDYFQVLQRLKPRIAIAENVTGLLRHTQAVQTIYLHFNNLGYQTEHRILNAADYGVPQLRRRVIFIARRRDWCGDRPIWPEAKFAPVILPAEVVGLL